MSKSTFIYMFRNGKVRSSVRGPDLFSGKPEPLLSALHGAEVVLRVDPTGEVYVLKDRRPEAETLSSEKPVSVLKGFSL